MDTVKIMNIVTKPINFLMPLYHPFLLSLSLYHPQAISNPLSVANDDFAFLNANRKT